MVNNNDTTDYNITLNASNQVTYNLTPIIKPGASEILQTMFTDCYLPYDDYAPTTTAEGNMCGGRYYLNDTGNDGVIKPNAGVIVDFNGGSLYGLDYGYGIRIKTSKHNIIIKNGLISNYIDAGIWITQSSNVTVINMSLYNLNRGIYAQYVNDSLFENNTIIEQNAGQTVGAIQLSTTVNSTVIRNNLIWNYSRGIDISGDDNILSNNEIHNVTYGISSNIAVSPDNNTIFENDIDQCGWNCYDLNLYNSSIYNNTARNSVHHCYDLFDSSGSGYNINSNVLEENTCDKSDGNGVYVCNASYNLIINNIVSNIDLLGIQLSCGSLTYSNNITGNSLSDISNYDITTAANNTYISNNTITGKIRIASYNDVKYDTALFIDNKFLTTAFYEIISDKVNITINESSTAHIINMSGDMVNWFSTSSTRKAITVENRTVTMEDMGTYNDVFNSTQETPVHTNVDNTTQQVASGDRVFVFGYHTSGLPRPYSIATTVDNVLTYTPLSYLSWQDSGSGNVILNTTSLEGTKGYIKYYIASSYAYQTGEELTVNTDEIVRVYSTEYSYNNIYLENLVGAWITAFSEYGSVILLAIIAIIGGGLLFVRNKGGFDDFHINGTEMTTAIKGVLISAFIVALILIILLKFIPVV